MASTTILTMEGAEKGSAVLSDAIFAVDPNEGLVKEVVVALMNGRRQGTHKTKERNETSGSGAKPFRQKGTGRARQGSRREPQMRGGGTVFGPRPRSYRQDTATRVKRKALCCALSKRLRDERITIVAGLLCEAAKTKPFAEMIRKLAPEARSTLVVIAEMDKNMLLSSRNIPWVSVSTAADLNVLDVLRCEHIILQKEAVAKLEERLS